MEMEPKSIHTRLNSQNNDIYGYSVDIKVTDFPNAPDRLWLYYFSLQVNFVEPEEWSHGGFQWAGSQEFKDNKNKGINWGGGSKWAGYGGIGVTNTPYTWEINQWYGYRVQRVDDGPDGLHRWLFVVMNYTTREEKQCGTVRTKSSYIKDAVVFTETGYGVQCDSPKARVEWRNPRFETTSGEFSPTSGRVNYNGTCIGATNTNQGILSESPLQWFHETNAPRLTPVGVTLWNFSKSN